MKFASVLLLAVSAFAQTPEIRGTVIEQGPNTGLPGAEVVLYEFVPNGDTLDDRVFKTIATDGRGAFVFQPGHLGDYRLEVRKPGYVTPDDGPRNPGGETYRLQIFLDETRPSQEFRVTLMIPSSLTGRVVDEDRKPVANFRVFVQPADSLLFGRGTPAVTDADGVFTASPLPPGPYIVRTAAEGMQALSIADYSDAEAQLTDEAFETAFWPGGVVDGKAALPLTVPPGSPANIGTMVLRKTRYFRAVVELAGECNAQEWTYTLLRLPTNPRIFESRSVKGSCRNRFLVQHLLPGSYALAISSGEGAAMTWAIANLDVARENAQARIQMSPVANLTGRFVVTDGKPLPALTQTRVLLRPDGAPNNAPGMLSADAAGRFIAPNLAWSRWVVSVQLLPRTHYVKEIRYNYQPTSDGAITLASGAELEIVLDDRPASITGTVAGTNIAILVERWPRSRLVSEGSEPFSYLMPPGPGGTFQITGLAPGEYRIRTVPLPLLEVTPAEGEKIVLGVGETKVVNLK